MSTVAGTSLQLVTSNYNAGTSVTLRWSSPPYNITEPYAVISGVNFLNFHTPDYKTYYGGLSDGGLTITMTERYKEPYPSMFEYVSGFFTIMARELGTDPQVFKPLSLSFRSYNVAYGPGYE